ncbi:MAG: hypothetical protein FJW26_22150 [Acidimicrobiia bacterium]|nr:hypothetical protein [Acidimicrobiia bacterium]
MAARSWEILPPARGEPDAKAPEDWRTPKLANLRDATNLAQRLGVRQSSAALEAKVVFAYAALYTTP